MNGKPLVFLAAVTLMLVGCNKEEDLITPTEMDHPQQAMTTASITSNNDNAAQATNQTVASDQSTSPLATEQVAVPDQKVVAPTVNPLNQPKKIIPFPYPRNKNGLLKGRPFVAPETITSTGNNAPPPATQNNAAPDVTDSQNVSDQSSSAPVTSENITPVDMNPQAPYKEKNMDVSSTEQNLDTTNNNRDNSSNPNVMPVDED